MNTQRNIWLVAYRPLAATSKGPWKDHPDKCLPFEDASCRREPDFRADPPTVSSACRPDFAGRLNPGDILVYVTIKKKYASRTIAHRRLTAVLEVSRSYTHAAYAAEHSIRARNCIVPGNHPLPWEYTEGYYTDEEGKHPLQEVARRNGISEESAKNKMIREWDLIYKSRQRYADVIVTCRPHYLELTNPPTVPQGIFSPGPFPGTQNVVRLMDKEASVLLVRCCGSSLGLV